MERVMFLIFSLMSEILKYNDNKKNMFVNKYVFVVTVQRNINLLFHMSFIKIILHMRPAHHLV
jgi:hypothetical protein